MNTKVIKVLKYINMKNLNNAEWSIELNTCQSKPMYGTRFDIELPPHIVIWKEIKEVLPNELINKSPDYFLLTEDGTKALFIWKL